MNSIRFGIVALAFCSVCVLGGCATKRYGRLQPVSSVEAASYTCRELAIEVSKVEAFLLQVQEGAEVDGASVLGFLGDLGIGNAIEKNAAEKSARERLEQLRELQADKGCLE